MADYYKMWQNLARYIENKIGYDVIIYPASIQPQNFHLALTLLPQPNLDVTGQIIFRLSLCARAKNLSSAAAISELTQCFIKMAELFHEPRGGVLGNNIGAMLYIRSIQEKDKNSKSITRSDEFSDMGKWVAYLQTSLNDIRREYGTIHNEKSQ